VRAIRFVTATRDDEATFRRTSHLFRSLGEREDLYVACQNREGLSKLYNRFLDGDTAAFTFVGPPQGIRAADDIIVFLHDDVEVVGGNYVAELNHWVDEGFSILGLAGAMRAQVRSPAFWHLMGGRNDMSGVSVYTNNQIDPNGKTVNVPDKPFPIMFGHLGEVVLLDGLFMAIALDRADAAGWRFDEAFDFHHYDIASCIRARDLGLRLRTVFVPVVHWDTGLNRTDPAWAASNDRFVAKYGERRLYVNP